MELKVKQPWYAEGLKFSCTQCGNCCTGGPGYVWLSKAEVMKLAEHLNLPWENVVRKYCRNLSGRLSLREVEREGQYDCIFLETVTIQTDKGEKTKRMCSIYTVRPLQCRTWPWWEGNLADEEAWKRAGEKCPGVNRGKKVYEAWEIEKKRDAKEWPEE